MNALGLFPIFAQTIPTSWVERGGIAGITVFILSAWLNEWLVTGKAHRRQLEEKDALRREDQAKHKEEVVILQRQVDTWQRMALESLGHAEKLVEVQR